MNEWKQINSKETLEEFLYIVDSFHDAFFHEAVLLNSGYVDEAGSMHGDMNLPNGRIIYQSQFQDVIGVELELKGISVFDLKFGGYFETEGEIIKDEVALYPGRKTGFGRPHEIRAKEIRYRLLGADSRGPQFRLLGINPSEIVGDDDVYD